MLKVDECCTPVNKAMLETSKCCDYFLSNLCKTQNGTKMFNVQTHPTKDLFIYRVENLRLKTLGRELCYPSVQTVRPPISPYWSPEFDSRYCQGGQMCWAMSGFVHRCGIGSSMRACQAAGSGSIPGRDKFPG